MLSLPWGMAIDKKLLAGNDSNGARSPRPRLPLNRGGQDRF